MRSGPTEISEELRSVPSELLADADICTALDMVRESAFSNEELEAYEKYWDQVRLERSRLADAKKEGEAIGEKRGLEKGQAIGEKRGDHRRRQLVAIKLLRFGQPFETIAQISELSFEELSSLRSLLEHFDLTAEDHLPQSSSLPD
jgi:hypothetical protein